ncbi:hypothetical protein DSM43518_01700 [Mycobacterium marinum]|uniref:Uncharacterized protein n=1 Tax=Mycobacterium marinum TaxID=1781 RepID=A0A3E2MUQ1_MYCMR|nr:hypothetical protein [Mycobacterium marinum]QYL27218.1 hypothetical protein TM48_01419 [Mycobacterium shottsii]CDM78570.1 hypothetical protein MMARE11_44330 [Mycobacterium marinum E11]AXN46532.1 hypothetical protein MM1218R_04620 [Mycobacterium marinum]AXN51958.1 hypothetical protein CCUG20998_04575 [Mycobacterium marinum]RFZ12041.1 hypothetical protein DSM43518_01700 [Mycobacterium marinum]
MIHIEKGSLSTVRDAGHELGYKPVKFSHQALHVRATSPDRSRFALTVPGLVALCGRKVLHVAALLPKEHQSRS